MKIEAAPPTPPPPALESLLAAKTSAASLFKASEFSLAAAAFLSLSSSAKPYIDLAPDYYDIFAGSCNNASLCHFKLQQYDQSIERAMESANVYQAVASSSSAGSSAGSAQAAKTYVKSCYRIAEGMISKAERAPSDGSVDVGYLCDEGRKYLGIVMEAEGENEMAVKLASRGLDVMRKLIMGEEEAAPGSTSSIEVVDSSTSTNDDSTIAAALGSQHAAVSFDSWGMQSTTSSWEEYAASQAQAAEEAAKVLELVNSVATSSSSSSSTSTSSTTTTTTITTDASSSSSSSSSVRSLISAANLSKKSSAAPAPSLTSTTNPSWSELTSVESSLTASFNDILLNRTNAAASITNTIRTSESNYSDSWRTKHAARRYEGKDEKRTVTKGGDTWKELADSETSAAVAVSEIVQRKVKVAKAKVEQTSVAQASENDDWRTKLKTRRTGAEIRITKKDDETVSNEWKSLLGVEDDDVERVKKLKEERRKAEKKAEKKRGKKEERNREKMEEILGR
jgi:hypothetical protein